MTQGQGETGPQGTRPALGTQPPQTGTSRRRAQAAPSGGRGGTPELGSDQVGTEQKWGLGG